MDTKQGLSHRSAWIVASFQKRNRGLERLTQNLSRSRNRWSQSWDLTSGLKDPVFQTLTYVASPQLLWRRSLPSHSSNTTPARTFPNKSPPCPSFTPSSMSVHTWPCSASSKGTDLPEGTDSPTIPSHGSFDKVTVSLAARLTLPLPWLPVPPFSGSAIVRQIYRVVSATLSSLFSVRQQMLILLYMAVSRWHLLFKGEVKWKWKC